MRKRALLLSSLLSIIVLIISVFGYTKLSQTHEQALLNVQERTLLVSMLNKIRINLLESYKDVNNFLLTPEQTEFQISVQQHINDAISMNPKLEFIMSKAGYENSFVVPKLNQALHRLQNELKDLFEVRLNSSQLYPSLAVASAYMRPNRVKMNNLIGVVHNEMNDEGTIRNNPIAYERFMDIRYLWNKVLSNFRIYLANKVGYFDVTILARQENSILVTYKEFQKNLALLTDLGEEQLGFESVYAIAEMKEPSKKWFEGFEKIKVIHQSDSWRLDAQLMKKKIAPEINLIVQMLSELEAIVAISAKDDFNAFASLNESQNILLWLVAFLGITFIVIFVLSLDRFIFIPITSVISALKSEALGKKGDVIPEAKSQEAFDLISAFSEMSHQVHLRQSELEYRALHDALTSLPNRTLLFDRVGHDIQTAKRDKHNLCLLLLDLDRFKEVNDTLGHAVGDKLLIELGDRLTNILRTVDTVARFGGDEFSVLLPNTTENEARLIANKIITELKNVMIIDGMQLYVTASIGIAVYPEHGEDVNGLLRLADIAMYVAKRNKTGVEIYKEENDENSLSRLSLTNDLREALENNLLEVYFQPIFNIKEDKIEGVESLCRWFHTELGSIAPEQFISLAENAGIINELTYWVLEQSIIQVKQWHTTHSALTVAVNISVYSFRDKLFLTKVKDVLVRHDFPHDKLTLEITEGSMMENPLQAIEVLAELKRMGVKLAVDDFGTGYSSMSYLKRLPVDELKIDKSFIIGMDRDKSNEAIVRSTIELAHNLGLRVIAEGVEAEIVLDRLSSLNCDTAQGYFMGRPASSKDIEKILQFPK